MAELDDVMRQIYEEKPEHWPYGLRPGMLDRSYLIRDPESDRTAGFVGWQFRRDEDGTKVGYYAVGVLPEFRRHGLAKKALKEMFDNHQPADVRRRRAFIVEGNTPSDALARSLQVEVTRKSASLHGLSCPPSFFSKMAKFVPSRYNGVSLQQFMPLTQRRERFTPQEQQAIEQGQSQWFPRVFTSWADSPAVDMFSPGRAALMAGLGGAGVAHLGLGAADASPRTRNLGALGVGTLGALMAYLGTRAHNSNVEEQMRRIPPNGTRRDMLSDPVLQAELDRSSRTGSSDEALRTAQLLAVLQATKQAADWRGLAKLLGAGAGLAGAHDVATRFGGGQDVFTTENWKARLANAAVNTALLGGGMAAGSYTGKALAPGAAAAAAPAGALTGALAAYSQLPGKDLALTNIYTGQEAVKSLNRLAEAMQSRQGAAPPAAAPPATSSFSDAVKWVGEHPWLAGGAALGGLGLTAGAGFMLTDLFKNLGKSMRRDAGGRIRVTLPTRRTGDAETQLDIPVSDMPLSNALMSRLQRDMRSRLHSETKERTRHVVLSPEERARRAARIALIRP